MSEQSQAPKQGAAGNGSRFRKIAAAVALFAAVGIGYGCYYALYAQYQEETDDAYVGANLIYVNSRVDGTVVALGADDNQQVKTGQPLVRMDKADAAVALDDAAAHLGETVREIRQQFRAVDAASAVVAQRQTDLARAQDDLARRERLAGSDSQSVEELDHARNSVAAAKDALNVAQKQLEQARAPVEGTTLRRQPSVLRARAAYVQAWLAAQRDEIVAPADGFVARRSVQVGQHVTPGAMLLAVVPLKGAWVDANFKEPQLRHIRVGQPATVRVDLYGGHVDYHGHVASISAGSGGAFSLLPPQNATGNWIKVVQRVPVRVQLDPAEVAAHPLRVGLSTTVNVDTSDRGGPVDTARPLAGATLSTPVFDGQLKAAETEADAIVSSEAGGQQ